MSIEQAKLLEKEIIPISQIKTEKIDDEEVDDVPENFFDEFLADTGTEIKLEKINEQNATDNHKNAPNSQLQDDVLQHKTTMISPKNKKIHNNNKAETSKKKPAKFKKVKDGFFDDITVDEFAEEMEELRVLGLEEKVSEKIKELQALNEMDKQSGQSIDTGKHPTDKMTQELCGNPSMKQIERTEDAEKRSQRPDPASKDEHSADETKRKKHAKRKKSKKRKKEHSMSDEPEAESKADIKPELPCIRKFKRARPPAVSPIKDEVKILATDCNSVQLLSAVINDAKSTEDDWKVQDVLYREHRAMPKLEKKENASSAYAHRSLPYSTVSKPNNLTKLIKFENDHSKKIKQEKENKHALPRESTFRGSSVYKTGESRRVHHAYVEPSRNLQKESNQVPAAKEIKPKSEEDTVSLIKLDNVSIKVTERQRLAIYKFINILCDPQSESLPHSELAQQLLKTYLCSQST